MSDHRFAGWFSAKRWKLSEEILNLMRNCIGSQWSHILQTTLERGQVPITEDNFGSEILEPMTLIKLQSCTSSPRFKAIHTMKYYVRVQTSQLVYLQ